MTTHLSDPAHAAASMTANIRFVIDDAFYDDPYPVYARLRTLPGPIFHEPEQTWLVSRYDHVSLVLKDQRFSKQLGDSDRSPISATMLFRDPPEHRRLREAVANAFTPHRVRSLTAHIEKVVDRLIDAFEGRRSIDFIADFATPLPVALIAEMLGVAETDGPRMCAWTAAIVAAGTPGVTDPSILQAGGEAVSAMAAFFAERIVEERASPRDTLLATLLAADGDARLDDGELLGTCMLLMIAGHETTVNLLGNGLYLLFSHPDQWELLKREPALMPSAVEEMLRFESPVQRGTHRRTTQAVEIGGTTIPAGALVGAIIGAANHDPSVFSYPDRFDIRRDPNPHLAFGNGIHYCLGAMLARQEAAIAFARLFERLPTLRPRAAATVHRGWLDRVRGRRQPTGHGPRWVPSTIVRGLESLPVEW